MPADLDTPLSVYWKLSRGATHSFLLESVAGGEQVARYSIIGAHPQRVLTSYGRDCFLDGQVQQADPLDLLRDILPKTAEGSAQGYPRFVGGAVGMIGYDYVRQLEDLPNAPPDELGLPDVAMMVCEQVVVFDHARAEMILISLASEGGESEADEWLDWAEARLRGPLSPLPAGRFPAHRASANMSPEQYCLLAQRVKDYICAGDCIQVVVSQRFSQEIDADAVSVYRALRSLNPSPYMFLMRFEGFDVVGASPELLTSLQGRTARVRPIAGTRKRGTAEDDQRLAAQLLADEKERAEHIMLVDLGRNDLGRVATAGSVTVDRLMTIEMYSHVMHIVSDVTAELRPELDGIDLIRATFPAGTLSGAQKVRAMQIIDELEPTKRGVYGGAVGTLSASGDIDLAIAIRSVLIKDGKAHVQAGAGIVYDSVPELEHQECISKAQAALAAIARAKMGEGF